MQVWWWALLLLATVVWPHAAQAQVASPRCPTPFTLSIPNSGSGTINANACHEGFGIGFLLVAPAHGTVTIDTLASTVTYAHNGDSALSDTFRFDDGSGFFVQVNVTIGPASAITVSPASLPTITAGTLFSQTLVASGGSAPYTFTLDSGTLPTGLTLSSAGVLSGTPTQRGPFAFSVRATDSTAAFGTKSYTPTVAGGTLSLSPNPPPNAVITVPYSVTFTPAGGVAPMSLMWEPNPSFPLPPGLSLAGNTLSGTPTATGTYTFGIRITDSSTGPGSWFQVVNVTMTVSPPPTIVVNPATIPNATVSSPYSQTLTGSGGAAPYSFTVTAGSLPAGLTLASNGTLSGTPTAGGTFNFTATATDNNGFTGSRAYSMTVNAPTIAVAPTTLPAGTLAVAYSQAISASGGTTPYTFAITAGAIPAGLTLASNGTLSGTPTASGTFNFTVTATDSSTGTGPYTGSRAYSLVIAAPVITIVPSTLTIGTVAVAYSQTLTASGGTAPYTFSVTAGTLPAGLTLASNGTLSGTATAGGTFNLTITATDANSATGSRAYALILSAPAISVAPATLPAGEAGTAYSQLLTASGGTAPYSFALTAGAIPAGMSLTSGGTLSGTPTAGGTFNFTVTATDSSTGTGPYTGSRAYSLTIAAATVVLSPSTLPDGTIGSAYLQTITATGGTAPHSFSVTAGALPPGMSFSSAGVLSGTPTAGGTFNFTVTATDSSSGSGPFTGSQAYSLTIAQIAPIANSVAATVAYGSGANPITLNITGGVPDSVAVATGPGNGTAIASGTSITYQPSAGFAGTDSFTYTASNSAGTSAPATVSITVSDPTITITPSAALTTSVGAAYTQTFTWSGGAAPYSGYSVTNLPAGLSVTASSSDSVTVSGTPTQAGTFNLDVSATDSSTGTGPFTTLQTFALNVSAPAITLSPASGTLSATANVAFSQSLTASGGIAPYTYAVTAGSLPAGLTLDSASGLLSGTPTVPGAFPVTITATDSSTGAGAPFSVSNNYTVQVAAAIVLSPSTLPGGTTTVAYNQPVTATGGTAPYLFVLDAGSLPPGLALASDGTLSGVPTTPGTFNFTVGATDFNARTGSRSYTLQVVPAPVIVVSPTTLPGGVAGVAYAQTLTASGGTAPYGFSLVAGVLPAGVSLDAAGALSGTPTVAGTFNFTVRATDAGAFTGDQAYSLVIAAPTITLAPTTLPDGVQTLGYSQTLTASGGVAPYGFSVVGGALPAGVTLSAAGLLSGAATVSGTFNFTARATDANGFTGDQAYALVIAPPPVVVVSPAVLPGGVAGVSYSQNLGATGGTAPHAFSLLSGGLPVGVSFSSAGAFSGTPMVAGTYTFTVRATDADGFFGDQAYSIVIAAPTISLTPATLPGGVAGVAYNQTVAAGGGTAPYAFSLLSGALPVGVSFSSAGVFSGTPTVAGTYTFTVRAADANGFTGDQAYSIAIAAPTIGLTPATLPDGVAGMAYSQTVTAAGGTAPYAFSLLSGALPAGVSFSSAGVLSGTPVTAGTFNFIVRASDANGFTGDQAYALVIASPAITVTPAALPDGLAGTAYLQNLGATGGTAPYSFSLPAGALPAGMSLSGAGVLAGTPTAAGTFNFTVRATDANGFTADQAYAITIAAPGIILTPATLPDAVGGTAYSQALTASGGTAPYAFSLVSGALPAGVSLGGTGVLAGTPTASGTFNFTVRATDANGFSADQAYVWVVASPAITLAPGTLPDGMVGQAYSQAFTASGGTAPHGFSIVGGALPAGVSLAATGELAGTPTAAGTFNFTVRATDANGFQGDQAYALTVAAPVISLAPASVPSGMVGVAYSQALTASGGTAPYTFALSSGALPPGITLTADGALSGTPTAAGAYNFDVTATDSLGFTATGTYVLTIAAAPPVAADDSGVTDAGVAVTLNVTANDSGSIDSIAVGSAPTHGTAVVSGLDVVYTPAAGYFGSDSFTYTAIGPGGTSNAATVTIDVRALAVPVGVPQSVTTLAGQPVSFDAATGASGGPFTGVTLVTSPAQGDVQVSGTTITYTPEATSSGTVTISYTLDNAFGSSASITSTVNINPMPLAAVHSVTTLAGVAVQVELTQGATGGPFTGADVVSVLPAGAGTPLVTATGPVGARQFMLTFTPSAGFVGTAQVSYTLDNAYATSAAALVSIDVTARPDPSQDAEVRGLLGAQAAAAKRFAHGQIDNFQSRMERLHDPASGHGLDNELTVAITRRCLDGRAQRPDVPCADEPLGVGGSGSSSAAAPDGGLHDAASNATIGVWMAGNLAFGDYDLRGTGNGFEFETNAASVGVDYRFSPNLVLGAGLGYGRDVSDIGDNGTRSKASANSMALYGSHQPAADVFLDLLVGYQRLSFDARRYIPATGGRVSGERDGSQWFGSLSATYEHRDETSTVAPYLRVDAARARLDAFTEEGDPVYALHYDAQDLDSTTGNLGVRLEWRRRTGWGLFSPLLRLEYQHDFEDPGAATLSYADLLGGPFYRVDLTGQDRSRFLFGLGTILQTRGDWLFKAEYRGLFGNDDQDEHAIMLDVQKEF